jgi:hypothetical protein
MVDYFCDCCVHCKGKQRKVSHSTFARHAQFRTLLSPEFQHFVAGSTCALKASTYASPLVSITGGFSQPSALKMAISAADMEQLEHMRMEDKAESKQGRMLVSDENEV